MNYMTYTSVSVCLHLLLLLVHLINLHVVQFRPRCAELFFEIANSSLQRFGWFTESQRFFLSEARSHSFLKKINIKINIKIITVRAQLVDEKVRLFTCVYVRSSTRTLRSTIVALKLLSRRGTMMKET
jgi:hypothetical protein